MTEPDVYSQRLGAISDAQFKAVSARLLLGDFLRATPTTHGLFGQNVFVTTRKGEFVLRGAPHWVKGIHDTQFRREDRWQFTKEHFFAQQLHERTHAPVPWPMRHDPTSDLLGWPYLVMPRMPGQCLDERSVLQAFAPADRRATAVALGSMLAELQQLTWAFAGDFDPVSIALEACASGNTQWVIDETRMFTKMAQVHGAITADDRAFIDAAAAQALAVPAQQTAQEPATGGARPNTFVHGDYKLNNLTVLLGGDGCRVSGVFDLHEARFGDGALDIVRQACSYLDTEPAMAELFVGSYLSQVAHDPRIRQLMPLYVINDRMKIWEFFTRPEAPSAWRRGKGFRAWAGRYLDAVLGLL